MSTTMWTLRHLHFGTYRRTGPDGCVGYLHNLLGIVTFSGLVVGITGMMNALSTPLFGLWRAQIVPALFASYRGQPMPNHYVPVDEAVAHAAAALPGMQITSVLLPNRIVSSPRHYIVWTKCKQPVTFRLFTPVLIDAATGQVTVAKGLPICARWKSAGRCTSAITVACRSRFSGQSSIWQLLPSSQAVFTYGYRRGGPTRT